jgi:protoheme IX farnesyltransferase
VAVGLVRRPWRLLPLLLELGKIRLSLLVVVTTAVGFALGSGADLAWTRLLWTVVGTLLAAVGANALNQWWEVARDARMERTRSRPLPARRLAPGVALAFGVLAGLGGPLILATRVNAGAAQLALATLLIYVLAYTPLKVRTPLNTLVGAVVGALPPVLGWVAVRGQVDPATWVLAGLLFVWQIPHFLALAWLYREDYARGGFRMLPVLDPAGNLTGCVVVVYLLALVPLSLLLTVLGTTGPVYAAGAVVLGTVFLGLGVLLERRRTRAAARRLFLASVIYLPLLLALMVIDRRTEEDGPPYSPPPLVQEYVLVRG